MFSLSDNRRYFLKDGTPHFFIIDTAWLALCNLTVEEFEEYAKFRAEQGYNGFLIMNTPVYSDMSDNTRYFPYKVNEDGSFNLSIINEDYYDQAELKLQIMQKYDITPFIVPVTSGYVPGTWLEKVFDCEGKQFASFEDYSNFVDYAIQRYKKYHTLWMIGGDDKLSENTYDYFRHMAEQLRKLCPKDLITAHVAGGSYIDERLTKDNLVDFYTYQSGHMYNSEEDLELPAKMADRCWNFEPKLPVINLEPMYEGHGFGCRFGRFDSFYLRRAFWYSVLAGANAGFTYGAHGIWMFYDSRFDFNNEFWSKIPFEWRTAMKFPGAKDTVYNSGLVVQYGMYELSPWQDLNVTPYNQIKIAAREDMSLVVAYTPYSNYINLPLDLTNYECKWYMLDESRSIIEAEVMLTTGTEIVDRQRIAAKGQKTNLVAVPENLEKAERVSRVCMYQQNCDAVLVCVKK